MVNIWGADYNCISTFYCNYHGVFSLLLVAFGILYLVFAELAYSNFLYAGGTFCTCMIIGMTFRIIRSIFWCAHKVAKAKQLRKCKNLMLFGLGWVYVIGWVPKLLVLWIGYDFHAFWSMFIICTISITVIFFQYIEDLPCEVLYLQKSTAFMNFGIFVHIIVLIALSRVGTAYTETKDTVAIIACQVVFFFNCCITFHDICRVVKGEIRVKNPPVENHQNLGIMGNAQVHPLQPRVEQVGEKADQKIECKICLLEYSETQVPRILKECGHTICEWCADHLLNISNNKYLVCPFCQMVTVVKGPANLLPKNYGMMDIVDNMKDK